MHADEIAHTEPGRIFVHRNIANLLIDTDLTLLSALEYAADHLQGAHIIVCGHYGCGGIRAAMQKAQPSQFVLNKWLKHIKDVCRLHRASLGWVSPQSGRENHLVELNVIEPVHNLAQTSTVQMGWAVHARCRNCMAGSFVRRTASSWRSSNWTLSHRRNPIYEYDLSSLT